MAVTKLHVQKHLKNSLMSRIEPCYEIYKLTIFREELAKSGAADFTVLRAIAKFTISRFFVRVFCDFNNLIQPPPQALHVSHGRDERETRVSGDELRGTMGRVETAGGA